MNNTRVVAASRLMFFKQLIFNALEIEKKKRATEFLRALWV